MHRRQPVPSALVALAARQELVVSREQALGLGLNRHALVRLVDSGAWQRLAPGLYLTAGAAPTWLGWAHGGVLLAGERARLGGEAAGYLHGLLPDPPQRITVLCPGPGRPRLSDPGPWHFVREAPGIRSRRSTGDPDRLTVIDTALDLCDQARDEREVIHLITRAVGGRHATAAGLLTSLQRRSRARHRRLLHTLLADVAAGAHSPLELRYLRSVERAHGLPAARRQVRRRNTIADAWYEEYAVLVELDGRLGHDGLYRFRDMERDNVAAVDGLVTLRYGYHDVVGMPCAVAAQVAEILMQRGWPGPFRRCANCRLAA